MRFALGQHLSAEVAAAVLCYGPEFDGLLPGYERYRGNHLGAFQAVNAAFEKLQRLLADAEALPLGLRQIRQADGSLAYSSLDTPGPRSGRSGDAVRVVLQLEASGKWPDELLALEKTRTACNLRLAQWLRTKHEAVRTAVSYEDRLATEAPTSVLDVTLDGILFRVDLHIDKHVTLLEKEIRLHPSSSAKADRAIARLRDFRRIYVQKPLHTQSIRSHCVRNPMISAAVRLFKLWVASHLLSDHIPSELAENLVLHTFIKPGKLPVPSSAMSTIFRVLHFISQWDWRHHPLLLLDSESDSDRSSAEELAAIRQRFDSGRQRDPNMRKGVIFMATGYDADGYTWTTQNPSLVSAARLTSLARAAVDILRKSAWDTKPKVSL